MVNKEWGRQRTRKNGGKRRRKGISLYAIIIVSKAFPFLYLIEEVIILKLGSEGDDSMKPLCAKRCEMMQFLANLKCPNCFSAETYGKEQDLCDCRLRVTGEFRMKWE
jgi:hypothetical protein